MTSGTLVLQPWTEPPSPALEGGFVTRRPPGKSQSWTFMCMVMPYPQTRSVPLGGVVMGTCTSCLAMIRLMCPQWGSPFIFSNFCCFNYNISSYDPLWFGSVWNSVLFEGKRPVSFQVKEVFSYYVFKYVLCPPHPLPSVIQMLAYY